MNVKLFETQDGSHSLLSETYGVSYHSKYGAIQESRHVFIEQGLYVAALQCKSLRILEMGFGTGLNAYLTLMEGERLGLSIYYEGVDLQPLDFDQVSLFNYPSQLQRPDDASLLRMHRADWNTPTEITPAFQLRKVAGDFREVALSADFDLVYYDAFAPSAQPELWTLATLARAYEAQAPGGILVTYCAKGEVKRHLRQLGFTVERLPGPPGKREMTRAVKC